MLNITLTSYVCSLLNVHVIFNLNKTSKKWVMFIICSKEFCLIYFIFAQMQFPFFSCEQDNIYANEYCNYIHE